MLRRVGVLGFFLVGVPAVAAESAPLPVVQTPKEAMPGPAANPATASERQPSSGHKAGAAPKNSRETAKPPPPMLDEKNLGLGCAQG